ncbi:MAG: retron Ec48 family effector membrane protein [Rudaea sp.]|uniref:retron Ec48 family effector membrane protein n=1 Tax=unclassified Rudaea TaxID=2627037 RepID=UPI0010F9756B|nr:MULTISPECIES: retron Ec48 family effector membrane protein [unclassified Rudaea]MBN8887845.1 retron Ec48 family effector membrane protein [Rudaea sp.]MBR0346206.1 retron Ec48 family effector membrane protein [Rudaea sp.]
MNSTINWIRRRGLQTLFFSLAVVISLGLLLSIISVSWTVFNKSLWRQSFCLSSDCIKSTKDLFAGSIDVLDVFSKISAWIATVGGIVVALLSYINSTAATAFGNHVSHSKIFYDYLTAEIGKRDRLNLSSVDIYRIYALAFENSRLGVMQVSMKYRGRMRGVAKVIDDSNALIQSASVDGFRFKDHQHRLIIALADLGIKLTTQPRIDFFEVEEEVFGLLDALNNVFCSEDPIGPLPQRNYR